MARYLGGRALERKESETQKAHLFYVRGWTSGHYSSEIEYYLVATGFRKICDWLDEHGCNVDKVERRKIEWLDIKPHQVLQLKESDNA